MKASTQARAASGTYWGAARSSARRRQIEDVDARDEQQAAQHGETGDERRCPAPARNCEPYELPVPMPRAPIAPAIR